MRPLALLLAITSLPVLAAGSRSFEFSYQLLAGELPTGEAVDIYLPLPAQHAGQRVVASSLQSNLAEIHAQRSDDSPEATALARSEGIPARFEIGFPVPLERPAGDIGGYHCWVQFYLPGRGWVPIDASEAAKHPQQRELLYGTHPADRIHFTTGRDLVLSGGSAAQPLNYFVYPYVEVGGKPWRVKLDTRFSYREAPTG